MSPNQSPAELQAEYSRRVGRHAMIFPLLVIGLGVPCAIGFAVKSLVFPTSAPPAWWLWTILGFLLAGLFGSIAYGFYSSVKNLRCPACENSVAMLTSWNASMVGALKQRTQCPHCHAEIVGPGTRSGSRRAVLIAVLAGITLVSAGALVQFLK